MPIRSGRFTEAGTIIRGRQNVYYRFLNSGEFVANAPDTNGFTISFAPGANGSVFLRPTFSVDLLLNKAVTITGNGAGETVEGRYDALPNPDFRNGRFKTKGTMDPTSGVKIVPPQRYFPGGIQNFQHRIASV
ncbi:MAG: hypothetical protein GY903_25285 [Fuerstiella sp.]|nr:hypothetical protein [Fuerstiella sp.]MCP4857811.1 hypothetical protein [Fuerstiella sp.]